MKCIGVVLSGCGVFDGSEIYETVLTLLAIERAGAKAICFAPDKPQLHVINHITGEEMPESRNVLVESARIVRGKVLPIDQADSSQLDALILPGGFGAAKNLSSFALAGADCVIEPNLQKLTQEIHKQSKPIGCICIAPAILPLLIDAPIRLTIGTDSNYAEVIEAMGGIHVPCPVDDIVVDEEHKIITTPAYMLASSMDEAARGIDKLVKRVVEMIA